jgi:hypothetical protein
MEARIGVQNDEDIPEYLKDFEHKPQSDGFGPEDIAWTGLDGSVDPENIIREQGHDPKTPLEVLLKALIMGHTPDADLDSAAGRLRTALGAITDGPRRGRPEQDDYDALMRIAWRYHVAVYETQPKRREPELRPIVRNVVEAYFVDVPNQRNITLESYIEGLENKFIKEKDILLSRVTTDEDWDRMDIAKRLHSVFSQLSELGIQIQTSELGIRTLRKKPR